MTNETDGSNLYPESSVLPTLLQKQDSQNERNDSKQSDELNKWTPLLVLGSFTCCFGSAVPAGFNIGVVNNPAAIIQNFTIDSIFIRFNKQLEDKQITLIWSIIVSIFLIGGVAGSLISSWLADKYGRRGAIAIGNVAGILGAFCFLLTPVLNSIEMLILGRIIVGFSGGIATSLVSMYMMEIATLKQRGAVGVFCQLGITVGVFLGQLAGLKSVMGTEERWHYMLASFAPLCFIGLVALYFLPESPKYLFIIKQEKERATKELARLRNLNVNLLQDEIRVLQEESSMHSTMETWTFGRVLREPSVRLPLLLVSSLQLGQQLSGINAVFYYSTNILKEAELDETVRQYATLGTGVINILMAVIAVRIMSMFGRRTLMFCSCYSSAICLFILCIGIITQHHASFVRWLCIFAVEAYVLCYGIGLGPIPYFIASELFDVASRPPAMAIGSVCNWGGNFIVGLLFPTMANLIGPYTFIIFIFFIISLALFIKCYLPETRGVNTTDIVVQLSQGFRRR